MLVVALLTHTLCATFPWQDTKLPIDDRVKDIVGRMSVAEKAAQMCNNAPGIANINLPSYNWLNEALHGVARCGNATSFPQVIGLAATFDEKAVLDTYTIVSDEARAKHARYLSLGQRGAYQGLDFFAPNVNIVRDPRWGRGQETWGEDPFLSGTLGSCAVKGMQGDDPKWLKTHATGKHWAVHSGPESRRHSMNMAPSKRDTMQTYLPAFKMLVEAGVEEIMCAYSALYGQPACANDYLRQKLEEWNYKGIIVTDLDSISDFTGGHHSHKDLPHACADAVKNGTTYNLGSSFKTLTDAVQQGLLSREALDAMVSRLFKSRFQLGVFEDPVPWQVPYSVVGSEKHGAFATEMARKSMVLLKNNGVLPLKPTQKVFAVGPNLDEPEMQWGNYNGFPPWIISVLDGLKAKTRSITHTLGVHIWGGTTQGDDVLWDDLFELVTTTKGGTTQGYQAVGYKGQSTDTPPATITTVPRIRWHDYGESSVIPGVGPTDYTVVFTGFYHSAAADEINVHAEAKGHIHVAIDGAQIVDGPNGGSANWMVTPGDHEIKVTYNHHGGEAVCRLYLYRRSTVDLPKLTAQAAQADVVVFVGGLNQAYEEEQGGGSRPGFSNGDRTQIEISPAQDSALKALKASGKPVIYVICSGSTISCPWAAENVDAILQAWYPGQGGGTAVADVLYGDYNPAGRLPVTVYRATADLPDFSDYAMAGRTYRYCTKPVLYPFGHGLSYTTFEYGKVDVTCSGRQCTAKFTLKNTGTRDGEDVPQVYVKTGKAKEPLKALKGFKRLAIKAGVSVDVAIPLPPSSFETYNEATDKLETVAGTYQVCVGESSEEADKRCTSVTLQ